MFNTEVDLLKVTANVLIIRNGSLESPASKAKPRTQETFSPFKLDESHNLYSRRRQHIIVISIEWKLSNSIFASHKSKMQLLDLPMEILTLLPHHLRNIQDFTDASSSCRTLYTAFAKTPPGTILRLAAASSRELFRPHPHFLIAATVRQVSEWARLRQENTFILRDTFENGIDALFDLCVSKAGITLDDIRRLHVYRYSTINSVIDMVDRCSGQQWYSTPNFWGGGVSDAETIDCEPQRAVFQIAIYGELFSSAVQEVIEPVGPTASAPALDLETRLDFIKYCIPDYECMDGYEGLVVKQKGPYARDPLPFDDTSEPSGDQVALRHLLFCRTWTEAWDGVRDESGNEHLQVIDETWRYDLWRSAVETQGLEGLEMLRPGGVEKWRGRLMEMKRKIGMLNERFQPQRHPFGTNANAASDAPCMADEVSICYWGG